VTDSVGKTIPPLDGDHGRKLEPIGRCPRGVALSASTFIMAIAVLIGSSLLGGAAYLTIEPMRSRHLKLERRADACLASAIVGLHAGLALFDENDRLVVGGSKSIQQCANARSRGCDRPLMNIAHFHGHDSADLMQENTSGESSLFGLVHGLGFADALSPLALAGWSLAGALAGFNLGVELGQAIAIGLAACRARPLGTSGAGLSLRVARGRDGGRLLADRADLPQMMMTCGNDRFGSEGRAVLTAKAE
jgi:hypothetical protein